MVNISNDQIKLLKKLLDEYFNHEYKTENFFEYQNMYVDLNWKVENKKILNKEQYEDRLFWKEYDKNNKLVMELDL